MTKSILRPLMLAAALGLLTTSGALSQISEGGIPPGSLPNARLLAPPTVLMEAVDVRALEEEDRVLALNPEPRPFRIGKPLPVKLSSATDGVWSVLPGGDKVWRLSISSPGAKSIMMALNRFLIPDGALLYVVNKDRSHHLGGFSNRNQQPELNLGIAPTWGDQVTLEYIEPADADFRGQISIGTIVHGYKDSKAINGFGTSGACNRNVVCPEGNNWLDQRRSVAMIADASGGGLCTGSMVNTANASGKNYFLTANHCSSGANVGNWVFWFNWESPTCNNPAANPANQQTVSGSRMISRAGNSDFCLLELTNRPPNSYNVYLNGWNRSYLRSPNGFGIHHPDGDIKKISTYTRALRPVVWGGTRAASWQVVWATSTTEGGSSGSPLFDSAGYVVGQLYGGGASCVNLQSPDNYGRFSTSWDTLAAAGSQLKTWLDPSGTAGMRQKGQYLKCQPIGRSLPFNEAFTNAALPADWETPASGAIRWARTNRNAFSGVGGSAAVRPSNNNVSTPGVYTLRTTPYNFERVNAGLLKFARAAKYVTGDAPDTLIVSYSTDCGTTFTTLKTYIGDSLNTVATPTAGSYTAGNAEWKLDSIVLPTSLDGARFVQFAFVSRHGANANNIYLDNINISGVIPVLRPTAILSTSVTFGCAPASFTFTDNSLEAPTSREWTFVGGTPATSNAASPTVVYANGGTYSVKLKVTNSAGSDSVTMTDYVTVKGADNLTLPAVETFDSPTFPPPGWRVIRNGNADSTWRWRNTLFSALGAASGSLPSPCASINNYPTDNRGSVDYLVSPGYNLSLYRTPKLTFNYAYRFYTGNPDTLDVAYTTDCGTSWTTLFSAAGANLTTVTASTAGWYLPTNASDFQDMVLPLTGNILTKDNVQFGFINRGGYGQILYLNEVRLDSSTVVSLANDKSLSNLMKLYPNPNSGNFTLEVPQIGSAALLLNATLTNVLGQILWSEKVAQAEGQTTRLHVADITAPAGLYFMTIEVDGKRLVKQFSIR